MTAPDSRAADGECWACNGLGAAIREAPAHGYRLFEWPCPHECPSLIPAIVRTHKMPRNAA